MEGAIPLFFFALIYGWWFLSKDEWLYLLVVPTLYGTTAIFFLLLFFKGEFLWDYSPHRVMSSMFFGFLLGWVLIFLPNFVKGKNGS